MSGPNKQPGYLFRAPTAWRDAAAAYGQTLAQWIRETCNGRAGRDEDFTGFVLQGRGHPTKPKRKPASRKRAR
jgi:hypothetical protein